MPLVATQITDRLAAIAATITTANGYASNVGATVKVAQLDAIGSDAPACILIPGRQQAESQMGGKAKLSRDYDIKAFVDLRDHPSLPPHELADLVLWDLRRRFSLYDAPLHLLINDISIKDDQPGYPENGGSLVGCSLTLGLSYLITLEPPTAP